MTEDISRKTVAMLLALTIIISVIGTLVVLEEAQKVQMGSSQSFEGPESKNSPAVAIVKVNVERPNIELQGGPSE